MADFESLSDSSESVETTDDIGGEWQVEPEELPEIPDMPDLDEDLTAGDEGIDETSTDIDGEDDGIDDGIPDMPMDIDDEDLEDIDVGYESAEIGDETSEPVTDVDEGTVDVPDLPADADDGIPDMPDETVEMWTEDPDNDFEKDLDGGGEGAPLSGALDDADETVEETSDVPSDDGGEGDADEIVWDAEHPDGGQLDVDHGDVEVSGEKSSALDDMTAYIFEHGYGREDYAEYSRDPEWQRLNEALIAENRGETAEKISDMPSDEDAAIDDAGDIREMREGTGDDVPPMADDIPDMPMESFDDSPDDVSDETTNLDMPADSAETDELTDIPEAVDAVETDSPVDMPDGDVPADDVADPVESMERVDSAEPVDAPAPSDSIDSDGAADMPGPADIVDGAGTDGIDEMPALDDRHRLDDIAENLSKHDRTLEDGGERIDDMPVSDALADGRIPGEVFTGTTDVFEVLNDTRLEELSEDGYRQLEKLNPERASQMLTEYNSRTVPLDALDELPRDLPFDGGNQMTVIDEDLSRDVATVRDMETGNEYVVYPNPMGRMSHMEGVQGRNELGMSQDCGIASTAKSINDVYGRKVTNENRLAEYASNTGICEFVHRPDGSIDYARSGGTIESDVREMYQANGLDSTAFVGNDVPTLDELGERLKTGEGMTLAVSSDLLWNYDDAQRFDFSNDLDEGRYLSDDGYRRMIDSYADMQSGHGTFQADHYVNVSNAVYDAQGDLTHFIVSDTGNGTTRMIPRDALQRAYNGLGSINVTNQGCVTARRRSA